MYVYNTALEQWEKIEAQQTIIEEGMKLTGDVTLKDHILDGKVNVIVQNGEGYTPTQYDENSGASNYSINETPDNVETFNENDTPRNEYDFTFAVESDTQYYNEDYEDNQDQTVDGAYQHQLKMCIRDRSKVDAAAEEVNVPVIGKMPLDRDIASAVDAGQFAGVVNTYLSGAGKYLPEV